MNNEEYNAGDKVRICTNLRGAWEIWYSSIDAKVGAEYTGAIKSNLTLKFKVAK